MLNRYKGNTYMTHKIWNTAFPEDKISPGDGFVIHHKNEIPKDNETTNLQKMSFSEHSRLHRKGKPRPDILGKNNPSKRQDVRARISKGVTGNINWVGRKHSKETKRKMSFVQTNRRRMEKINENRKA